MTCACGCGETPPLAHYTAKAAGIYKGQPTRFIHGHNLRVLPEATQRRRIEALRQYWLTATKAPTPGSFKPGDMHHNWVGDAAVYRTVHQRLAAEFGPASNYQCVGCSGQAKEWAFDEPNGFSTDLSRYAPRCRSCHRYYDDGVKG